MAPRPDLLREPGRQARARRGRAPEGRPRVREGEEATEGEEIGLREKLKTVGAEKRLGLVARDIVEHFGRCLEAMIVRISRRVCVELHREIVKLRPDWDGGKRARS
jgi:type I restriction enzyme R subunit